MRHPRITIAVIVLAVGATAGGFAAAAGGASASYPTRIDPSRTSTVGTATVNSATASVNGKTELILVDSQGDPLYTFKADTPTNSRVTGQLATLWPPLDASGAPTAGGVSGKLTLVSTPNGRQVTYNGHFLYSFVDDRPGHVTGQGVQDFFVATPTTGVNSTTPAPAVKAPAGNGYGY